MKILVIDTASTICAACVYDTAAQIEDGRAVVDLGKGHAEHLMSVVKDALQDAKTAFDQLGAIAVSIGPGSFTGVRVGVSAARGFAMALKIPATGITTLEAIACEAREAYGARKVMCALDAGRDEINAAIYDEKGELIHAPSVMDISGALDLAVKYLPLLAGSAAARIANAAVTDLDIGPQSGTADIGIYARLAAGRAISGEKPRPLYLRGADAKPQAGFVLPRLSI